MVEYITYHKKKYPVSIAYYALKMFKKEVGKAFNEIQNEIKKNPEGFNIELYEPLLYYGLVAGAKIEEEEFTFERQEAEFILDECFYEFIEIFPKFFPDNSEKKSLGKRQQRRKEEKIIPQK